MRRLCRRIQALEAVALARHNKPKALIGNALMSIGLGLTDLEQLCSALGADQIGRALTPSEVAARERYREEMEAEFRCFGSGMRPPIGCERTLDPDALANAVGLKYIFPQDLALVTEALLAAEQGRVPDERGKAIIDATNTYLRWLCRLASGESPGPRPEHYYKP